MKPNFYPIIRKIITLIILLTLGNHIFSQSCSALTATYSTSESRCIATGAVTVTASGGSGTYNYKVTGPTSTAFTSSNVITGLTPGSYMLTVKDINSNCLFTATNIVIDGSYSDPRFALSGTDVTCINGGNGTITATSLTNGRGPFTFTIVSPSASNIGASNSVGAFTNLVPGNYSVQLADSCGGIQTRTITVQDYDWWFTSTNVTNVSCTGYNVVIGLQDTKGNTNASSSVFSGFQYGVVNSPGDTTWSLSYNFPFDLGQKRSVTFAVKDNCGHVKTSSWTNPIRPSVFANATISSLTCSGYTVSITGQQNLTNPQYCLFDNSNTQVACNSTGIFTNIPYGSYCINITNTCYDTVITRCFTQAQPVPAIGGTVTISNYSCTSVTATVTGQQNLTSPVYCLFDAFNTNIACNSTGVFNNVPYGAYHIEVTDGCTGTVLTVNFDAPKRTRSVASSITVNGYTCTTFNASITGQSNLSSPTYCLLDSAGNNITCNSTGIFTGLDYGTYCINVTDGCGDTTITRCVTVGHPVPTIGATVISAKICGSFTATISGISNFFGGNYCIFDSVGNQVACNSTGVFTGLPYGTYCVKATDGCTSTQLTNCFTATGSTPAVGGVTLSNQTCSGFRATQTGQSNLTNPQYCLLDSSGTQITCNSTGIFDINGYGTYSIQTTDGCDSAVFIRTFSAAKPIASVGASVNFSNQNCSSFTATIIGQTNLGAATYTLVDSSNAVVATNGTGVFNNIAYGSYCINIANGCNDTTIQRCFSVAGNNLNFSVTATPSCVLTNVDINVNILAGYGPYTINVYDSLGNLLNTATTSASNYSIQNIPAIIIGQRYTVQINGSCGTTASQTVTGFPSMLYKNYNVVQKCPSGVYQNGSADLLVNATTNLGSISIVIIQKNSTPVSIGYSYNSGSNYTFSSLEPATYILRYTLGPCTQTVNDTITVSGYQYPNLSKSAAFQCDNNNFSVSAAVNGGVAPFTYEVIGSSPALPSLITGTQLSPVFGISNGVQYSLIRLRASDACGNATLNDVSILPLANTVITATSTCYYNNILLTTDTIPNANYQWFRKTSPVDSVEVGTDLSYNIPYLLPTDTGMYIAKMTINSGCLTKLSYFEVNGQCAALLPLDVKLAARLNQNKTVAATWVSKSESKNTTYIVERSNDGSSNFNAIGTVAGTAAGASITYSFNDQSPLQGVNYYRLRVETESGKIIYSNVVLVTINSGNHVSVYPNPVKSLLNISISGKQNQSYQLVLANAAGQVIYATRADNIQNAVLKYQRNATVKPGVYMLQVTNVSTGEHNTFKLMFE